MKNVLCVIALAMFLLAACSTVKAKPVLTPSPTTNPVATFTLQPKALVVTPVITLQLNRDINIRCLNIQSTIPNNFESEGEIILKDYYSGGNLFGMDLSGSTPNITTIGKYFYSPVVSPNGKILAVGDGSELSRMLLIDTNNKIIQTTPWQKNWWAIVSWLNDSHLAISDNRDQMIIFDPFTSEEQNIVFSEFPDFNFLLHIPWVEYDPSLLRVIYSNENEGDQVLLNLENMQPLAMIPDDEIRPPDASWTLNGNYFALVGSINGGDEIFVVSRDGVVEQLTHLANYYGANASLSSPRWSPDDKSIAFWEMDSSNNYLNVNLVVADTTTKQVTNYCITSYPYSGNFGSNLPAPIWSPDSKQIIVENRYNENNNHVVLVDISQNIAMQVAQDARPIGWMINEP
jgi:Tol biopolymer transport system component